MSSLLKLTSTWGMHMFCRLDCLWVGAGLADVHPVPLIHAFGFTIAEASASRPAAQTEAPNSTLMAEEVASGCRWSAKVVLFSGVEASALHANDNSEFQVTGALGLPLVLQHPPNCYVFPNLLQCAAAW